MTNTADESGSEAVVSKIFAYSGIECRLTVSQLPVGYVATAYCPYCGKDIVSAKSDANQESAISRTKGEFQDHLGYCPLRNSQRPPLGVHLISPAPDNAGS